MTNATSPFSTKDLAVLERREVTQADRRRLTELGPDAVCNDALAWIAAGESVDEAIELATEKARRDAEYLKNPDRKPSEAELSDSDWLIAYCSRIRQQLHDPSTFDRGALTYRRARTDLQVQKTSARREIETSLAAGFEPFADLAVKYLFVNHPRDWAICPACNGQNTDHPTCDGCRGAGYIVTSAEPKRN